jgi:hypothetical protein
MIVIWRSFANVAVPKIDWVLQSNYATSAIPVRPWLPKRRRQTACCVTYRNSYA